MDSTTTLFPDWWRIIPRVNSVQEGKIPPGFGLFADIPSGEVKAFSMDPMLVVSHMYSVKNVAE